MVKLTLREYTVRLGLVLASLTFFFIAAELCLRTYQFLRYHEPLLGTHWTGAIDLDSYLGWKAKPDYASVQVWIAPNGTSSLVAFSQGRQGFRMFGDLHSPRRKVMVLGDSYTQAVAVSNDQTYYAILAKLLDADIFAYGVQGYGTLQEYMVLDKYIDLIKPDLLICQLCVNDFINNSLDLESLSTSNNDFLVRPYWESGQIIYALPFSTTWGRLVPLSFEYSRVYRGLSSRLRIIHARSLSGRDIFNDIRDRGGHQLFPRAVSITDALLARIRKRAGKIPIVAFDCIDIEPYHRTFRRLAANHGLYFVDVVTSALHDVQERGADLRSDKAGHWNSHGHKIVGEALAAYITQTLQDWHRDGLR